METAMKSPAQMSEVNKFKSQSVLAGFITGQIAGLLMAVVVMLVFTVFLGKGPLYPVQVIGSVIFGEAALQGFHLGAFLAGLALHQMGPALLWGVLFGLAAGKLSVTTGTGSLILGTAVGIISMVGPYLLIPAIMNILHGVDFWNREVPMVWDWAAHIVFGVLFVLYPKVQSQFQKNS